MQSSSIVLKHSDISNSTSALSASSAAGYYTDGRARTVFNINLRNAIGPEVYDKHKRFVVRVNSVSHTAATGFATAAQDQSLLLRFSGLQFANSCYDLRTGNQSQFHDAFMFFMENTTARTFYLSQNVGKFMIDKGSGDNVELVMQLIRQSDGNQAVCTTTPFPHMCVMLDVFPCIA